MKTPKITFLTPFLTFFTVGAVPTVPKMHVFYHFFKYSWGKGPEGDLRMLTKIHLFFLAKTLYIYIYIYSISQIPNIPIRIGPGTSFWAIFAKTPKNMRRHRGGFFGFSGSKMTFFIDF